MCEIIKAKWDIIANSTLNNSVYGWLVFGLWSCWIVLEVFRSFLRVYYFYISSTNWSHLFEFGVVELFWPAPGLRSASMQNNDLGRLNVVDGSVDDDVVIVETAWGEVDEFRRSKPELDEIDAGEPGDDIWPAIKRCPAGDKLRGGEHGGEAEFGRIFFHSPSKVHFVAIVTLY